MSLKKTLLVAGIALTLFIIYWMLGHPYFKESRLVMFLCVIVLSGTILYFIGKAPEERKSTSGPSPD